MTVIVEDFEGYSGTPNSPLILTPGFLLPGFLTTFTFDSGLRLTAPIPNNTVSTGTLLGDFAISPGATWGVTEDPSPGDVTTASVVPSGTGYLGSNVEEDGTLTFGFSTNVFTVGAFVNSGDRIGIAAYDAAGKLISAARVTSVIAADWDENFVQVMSPKPIAKVVFTGQWVIADDVTFDTSKPKIVKGSKFNDFIGGKALKGTATNASELILAKKGNDKVFGLGGDDIINGGQGKDKLHGGDGNDTLIGGPGKDKLWGDDGEDSYLFDRLDAVDVVKNFDVSEDSILLAHSAFTGFDLGTLDSGDFFFTGSMMPVSNNPRILYNPGTGALSLDNDGDGPTAPVQFAKLPTGLMLSDVNFFVV